MAYLADTNVVTRRILPDDPQHGMIRAALLELDRQGETVYITPQVMTEFHALATRPPAANGLGMTAVQARTEAQRIEAIFPLLPDVPAIYPQWRHLTDTYEILGRQVYDARLVAVMLVHGITHILTLNAVHFRRFSEITIVEPADILSP
jgi:predicted nucleic acid-binding protein